jgi:hypothetical protein
MTMVQSSSTTNSQNLLLLSCIHHDTTPDLLSTAYNTSKITRIQNDVPAISTSQASRSRIHSPTLLTMTWFCVCGVRNGTLGVTKGYDEKVSKCGHKCVFGQTSGCQIEGAPSIMKVTTPRSTPLSRSNTLPKAAASPRSNTHPTTSPKPITSHYPATFHDTHGSHKSNPTPSARPLVSMASPYSNNAKYDKFLRPRQDDVFDRRLHPEKEEGRGRTWLVRKNKEQGYVGP